MSPELTKVWVATSFIVAIVSCFIDIDISDSAKAVIATMIGWVIAIVYGLFI